jgi:hypothetical protein
MGWLLVHQVEQVFVFFIGPGTTQPSEQFYFAFFHSSGDIGHENPNDFAHFDNPLHFRLAVVICEDILFIISVLILNNFSCKDFFNTEILRLRLTKRSSAQSS